MPPDRRQRLGRRRHQEVAGGPMTQLEQLVDRLADKARGEYYNPYTLFNWPDSVPADAWWMSPELLSVHGTGLVEGEQMLKALARAETTNFFSLDINVIRDL